MDNSFLAQQAISLEVETPEDVSPQLRGREEELTILIHAIEMISSSKEWSTLTSIFEDKVGSLKREIATEAMKDDPSTNKLNRLSGKLEWAEQFADLKKMGDVYRVELSRIRNRLYATQ